MPFGIISTTGVAGLTLSGGHGYLSRQYGLAVDNLLEADVVLADGSFVTASEFENPDLFWALRGGGGNFGVVTSFLFRTSPVAMIYGGPIIFEFSDAAAVMKWFRDNQPKAPDDFYMFLGLQVVPPGDPFPKEHWSKKMCVLVVAHNGPLAEGEKAVNAVRSALPKPIIDWAQPMPYTAIQTLFDPLLPKGLQWYWKGDFVKDLSDAAIEAHLAQAKNLPERACRSCIFTRSTGPSTPGQGRDRMGLPRRGLVHGDRGIDPDPANGPRLKEWVRTYWNAVHPYDLDGAYANFMMDDEGEARVKAAYGGNYERLAIARGNTIRQSLPGEPEHPPGGLRGRRPSNGWRRLARRRRRWTSEDGCACSDWAPTSRRSGTTGSISRSCLS